MRAGPSGVVSARNPADPPDSPGRRAAITAPGLSQRPKQREHRNDPSKFVRLPAASKFQSRSGKFSVFGSEREPPAAGRSQAPEPATRPDRPVWNLLSSVVAVHLVSVVNVAFIAVSCSLLSRLKSSEPDLTGISRP